MEGNSVEQGEYRQALREGAIRHGRKRNYLLKKRPRSMALKCYKSQYNWVEFWVHTLKRQGEPRTYVRVFSKPSQDRPVILLKTQKFYGRCNTRIRHMLDDLAKEARVMGYRIERVPNKSKLPYEKG